MKIILFILVAWLLSMSSCINIVVSPNNPDPLPTAPSSWDEIIHSLSSPDYGVRFVGIAKLRDMGPSAKSAVPQLIVALSDDSSDIRAITADALGRLVQTRLKLCLS